MQRRVEDLHVRGQLDVARGDVGRAACVEAQGDGLLRVDGEHEILEVQDDVGDVFLHPGDGGELVQGVVEADLGDGCAGDRRQQRAAQRVAQGVPEAGLERCDRKPLTIALGLAEGLDRRALNDQHVKPFFAAGLAGLLGVELDDE